MFDVYKIFPGHIFRYANYFLINGLDFSVEKSVVVIFSNPRLKYKGHITSDKDKIPWIKSAKYLGMFLNQKSFVILGSAY